MPEVGTIEDSYEIWSQSVEYNSRSYVNQVEKSN